MREIPLPSPSPTELESRLNRPVFKVLGYLMLQTAVGVQVTICSSKIENYIHNLVQIDDLMGSDHRPFEFNVARLVHQPGISVLNYIDWDTFNSEMSFNFPTID